MISKRKQKKAKQVFKTMALYRRIPFNAQSTNRAINIQIPLYVTFWQPSLTGSYSFAQAAATPTLSYDVLTNIYASTEFTTLRSEFGAYRIKGFELSYASVIGPGLSTVHSLPPAYIMPNYGYTGSLSYTNIAKSDLAFEVKVNNTDSRAQKLKIELPAILTGNNGYPIMGHSLYIATQSASATGQLYLNLGALNSPQFASIASSQYYTVGTIDIVALVEFVQPILY